MLNHKNTKDQRNRRLIFLGCMLAGISGAIILWRVSAATPPNAFEPEAGALKSPAKLVSNAAASGGQAVQFGPAGIIGKSGTNLVINGTNIQFIGFNAFGMTGCRTGAAWTAAQLDAYFAGLPPNGITRTWAFQYYGTARINTILTEAAKYNQRLILTLGDDDSACNDLAYAPAGDGSGKTLAFYQTGWKADYLTWVNTIVPLFKNHPSVGMWEIANEPGHSGAKPDALTMKTYLDGAAAAIKAADPSHLVSSGANCSCDGGLGDYAYAHSGPNIDVISFHDYAWEYENKVVVSGNYTKAKAAATSLNKPFIAGEAGVPSGATCAATSLSTRTSYLKQKADSYIAGGIGGIAFWDYEPGAGPASGQCSHEINPGDPLLAVVKNYVLP